MNASWDLSCHSTIKYMKVSCDKAIPISFLLLERKSPAGSRYLFFHMEKVERPAGERIAIPTENSDSLERTWQRRSKQISILLPVVLSPAGVSSFHEPAGNLHDDFLSLSKEDQS